jgi:hypothetical protein
MDSRHSYSRQEEERGYERSRRDDYHPRDRGYIERGPPMGYGPPPGYYPPGPPMRPGYDYPDPRRPYRLAVSNFQLMCLV